MDGMPSDFIRLSDWLREHLVPEAGWWVPGDHVRRAFVRDSGRDVAPESFAHAVRAHTKCRSVLDRPGRHIAEAGNYGGPFACPPNSTKVRAYHGWRLIP